MMSQRSGVGGSVRGHVWVLLSVLATTVSACTPCRVPPTPSAVEVEIDTGSFQHEYVFGVTVALHSKNLVMPGDTEWFNGSDMVGVPNANHKEKRGDGPYTWDHHDPAGCKNYFAAWNERMLISGQDESVRINAFKETDRLRVYVRFQDGSSEYADLDPKLQGAGSDRRARIEISGDKDHIVIR